jgi:hypothetical protein
MAAAELCSAVSRQSVPYISWSLLSHKLLSLICDGCLTCLSFSCNLFQGFTAVTDIAGGFSAWKENGLPVSR